MSENEQVLEHAKLVHWTLSRRWKLSQHTDAYDDAASWAFEGLLYAIRHFDPARTPKFSTYAVLCMNTRLCIWKRQRDRWVRLPVVSDEGKNDDGLLELVAVDRRPNGLELRDEVARVLKLTGRKGASLLRRRFLKGETFERIGQRLGVTKEAVRTRILRVLEKARSA